MRSTRSPSLLDILIWAPDISLPLAGMGEGEGEGKKSEGRKEGGHEGDRRNHAEGERNEGGEDEVD